MKSLAFKDSLSVSEVVGLQSALSSKQDVLGYTPVPRNSNVSDYSVWNDSDWGFSEWVPSSQGIPNNGYGTSFNFRDISTWYFRLMFGTNGRIYHYSGINTTTMTNLGTLAYLSDIPTNNNQLTNGAGYITSSGSCAYATSAGSAPASDVYAWAKKSSLALVDIPDLSSKYLSTAGGTISITNDEGICINRTNGTRGVLSFKVDGGYKGGLGIDTDGVPFYRTYIGGIHTLIHSGNYNSYAPKLDGTGATGTWGINIIGNAESATKLQTPRTIWGQSFDGTGDVSGALTGVTDITASGYVNDAGLGYISNNIGGVGWHTVARLSNFHETADIYISNAYYYHPTQGLHIRIANGVIEVLSSYITTITKVRFVDKDVDIYYSVENFDTFYWRVIGNGCGSADGSISTKTGGNECAVNMGVSVNAKLSVGGDATIAGNVGIGTTSPSAKLHVAGDAIITGDITTKNIIIPQNCKICTFALDQVGYNRPIFGLEYSGSTYGFFTYIQSPDSDSDDGVKIKSCSGSDLVTFLDGGNVGIGTTSPSAKLHVNGNILATGAVTAGQASDARLKSNIVTVMNACGILRSLRGVEFDWNTIATDNCKDLTGHDVGLIAQEVESLIPSAIGTIWGEYKRLDYTKITPYLVEGWKAHDVEIQRLKTKIKQLEERIYGMGR